MKKFKVGDYIKGVKDYDDSKYQWTTNSMTFARVIDTDDDEMTIKVLGHANKGVMGHEYIVDNSEEEFKKIDLKKNILENLPFGAVIKFANDETYVIADGTWYGEDSCYYKDGESFDEDEFNDDLEYIDDYCDEDERHLYNIQKITYGDAILYIREPKIVKEMTVEEVCKELGYDVKIIKKKGNK
jgi:hypothetical protein